MTEVVITGVSKGIGRALVPLFTEQGYRVIGVARNESRIRELRDTLNHPERFQAVIGDIGNVEVQQEVVKACNPGQVRFLIHNAGQLMNQPFGSLTEASLTRLFRVNVFAPILLTKQLLPLLQQASERAHVVHIGSMGGFQGAAKFPGLTAYSASKGALAIFSESLAEEYRDASVSFNTLALGAVQTEMLEQAFPECRAPVTAEQMAKFIFQFTIQAQDYQNGKVSPVSLNTP